MSSRNIKINSGFQSTPSVGRATAPTKSPPAELIYFNPRPPWGGRRFDCKEVLKLLKFQSTPSVGRATCFCSSL